jgi:Tfp pilus assembly protein PilN
LAALVFGAFVWMDRDAAAREANAENTEAGRQRAGVAKDIDMIEGRLSAAKSSLKDLNIAFNPAQPISDVLTLVSNSVPDGAWLTGVTFERGKPLLIRGTALEGSAVTSYVEALALNERLRDVQLVFANNAEIEGTPVVQFSISAHVVGNLPLADSSNRRAGR